MFCHDRYSFFYCTLLFSGGIARDAHASPLEVQTCGKYSRDTEKRQASTPYLLVCVRYLFVFLKNWREYGETIVQKERLADSGKSYMSESARSSSKTMKYYEN